MPTIQVVGLEDVVMLLIGAGVSFLIGFVVGRKRCDK